MAPAAPEPAAEAPGAPMQTPRASADDPFAGMMGSPQPGAAAAPESFAPDPVAALPVAPQPAPPSATPAAPPPAPPVPPPMAPPAPPSDPEAARFENAQYHWQDAAGQQRGPSGWAEYKAAHAKGDTHAGCLVFAAGVAASWAVVRDVPGLAQRVAPPPPPAMPAAAPPMPTNVPPMP